jgi:hypothetical protein
MMSGVICSIPFHIMHRYRSLPSIPCNSPLNLLTRRLLGVLRERVLRVRAQSALGVVRVLLRALGDIAALVVDVVAGLACLRIRLPLGLGGLAAGVGGRHDEVCVWSSSVACEVVGEGWEVGEAYGWVGLV